MPHITRASAVAAASAKWSNFTTYFDLKMSLWYAREVDLGLPTGDLEWGHAECVHHVEWAIIEGGRLAPCAVVTCALADIPGDVPAGWVVQPLDPAAWRDPAAPSPVRPRSTVESPVKVVWRIAGEMIGAARKDVIAACVALGVDKSTASTQFYKWGKAQQGA